MTPFVISPELYLTFIIIAVLLDYFFGKFNFIHSPLHFISFLCYLSIFLFSRIKENRIFGLISLILLLFIIFIAITFILVFLYQINEFLFAIFFIWFLTAFLGEKRLSHRTQLILKDLYSKNLTNLRERMNKIFFVQTDILTKKELCRLAVESTAIDGITEVLAPLLFMVLGVFSSIITPYINPLTIVAIYKGIVFFLNDCLKLEISDKFTEAANSTLQILNYYVFYISSYLYVLLGGFIGLNFSSALEAFSEIREKSKVFNFYPIVAVGGLFALPIVTSIESDETTVIGLKETTICEEDLIDLKNIILLSEVFIILLTILLLFMYDLIRDLL